MHHVLKQNQYQVSFLRMARKCNKVVITHDENTSGDGLYVSPNGEKDIHIHEKADANKDNCDGLNKGEEGVNTSSSETESVCDVIP